MYTTHLRFEDKKWLSSICPRTHQKVNQILERLNDGTRIGSPLLYGFESLLYSIHPASQTWWRRNYENNYNPAENKFVGIFPSFRPNLKFWMKWKRKPTWITFFPAFFGRTNHFTWDHNESLQRKCYFDYYFV